MSTSDLVPYTEADEQFARTYLAAGCNATEAYLRLNPGVTRPSAATLGAKYLRRVETQAALERVTQELKQNVKADTEALAQRLKAIALGDLRQVAQWGGTVSGFARGLEIKSSDELTDDEAALIEEVEYTPTQHGTKKRVKLTNRLAAARLLLEMRGELVKTLKVDGEIRHVLALPAKQPSREEWMQQFGPNRQLPPST